jgi:hypothetical protein
MMTGVTALFPGLAGALCGIATLLAMRRFSDQEAIRVAKSRMLAHLYELRLFGDDPRLVLRAQKSLLTWNLRYLRLALLPAAIVAIPAILIALQLNALYGKRALTQGEATVVTVELKPETSVSSMNPVLTSSPAFRVESLPVRIEELRQICWRVRATGNADGILTLTLPGEAVERSIRAGPGLRYVSAACASSVLGFVIDGCRIHSNLVESISIEYAEGSYWLLWFALFWFVAMLALRGRFGVTF